MPSAAFVPSSVRRAGRGLRGLALAGLGCLPLACGSAGATDAAAAGGAGGGAGAAGADAGVVVTELAFEPSTLGLVPNEQRAVEVLVQPPGLVVDLALEGGSAGASIDRGAVTTDAEGRGTVVVTAPDEPATFSLRATAGDRTARLPVSVSAAGFATLSVEPRYTGGREVPYWLASAQVGTPCSSLIGTPPPDGALTATALPSSRPLLTGLPAGPALTITLRGGWLAGGCLEVGGLTPGSTGSVVVQVQNRPLRLGETRLALRLETEQSPWTAILETAAVPWVEAALDAPDEPTALSEALLEAAAADGLDLSADRALFGWDAVLAAALPAGAVRAALEAQVVAGGSTLQGAPLLTAELTVGAQPPGVLGIQAVAGLAPDAAGFAGEYAPVSWSGDADDTVLLGVEMRWFPSVLLGGLAEAQARAQGRGSAPAVIADSLGCAQLGALLTTTCATCDLTALCERAVAVLWQRGVQADVLAGSSAVCALSATGPALLDDQAHVVGFSGTWLASLTLSGVDLRLTGPVTAAPP